MVEKQSLTIYSKSSCQAGADSKSQSLLSRTIIIPAAAVQVQKENEALIISLCCSLPLGYFGSASGFWVPPNCSLRGNIITVGCGSCIQALPLEPSFRRPLKCKKALWVCGSDMGLVPNWPELLWWARSTLQGQSPEPKWGLHLRQAPCILGTMLTWKQMTQKKLGCSCKLLQCSDNSQTVNNLSPLTL